MIIRKLELISFGKFSNTAIELDTGLNLIGGDNESGKSTIHKFIEGMFFGFFKPYSKNKLYTNDYDLFLPWNGGDYRGALEYFHEGREYRLERNFHKSNEKVSLFDKKTGKDLTTILPFDSVQKLPRASHHLNMSSTLFRNTISIAQMCNATESDLAKEIGDLIANAEHTYDGTISFQKALENLQKTKNAIGTKKQSKSPIGIEYYKLEQLIQEQQSAEQIETDCREKYLQIRAMEQTLKNLAEQKDDFQQGKERTKIAALLRQYKKYQSLEMELDQLNNQLANRPAVTETQFEAYQQMRAKHELTKQNDETLRIKKQLADKILAELEAELQKAKSKADSLTDEDLAQDAALLSKRLKQMEEYGEKKNKEQTSSLGTKYKALRSREKLFSLSGTTLTALAISAAAVGYFFQPTFFYWAAGLGAVGISMLILWGITATKRGELEPYFDRYDTMKIRTTNMIVMCEIEVEQLKQKYNCDSVEELRQILNSAQTVNTKLMESERQVETQQQIVDGVTDEINHNREEMQRYEQAMSQLLSDAGVQSAEDMKRAILSEREQSVIRANAQSVQKAMDELLSEVSLDQMKKASERAAHMDITDREIEVSETENGLDQTNDQILETTAKIASLQGSIAEAENAVRSLGEIEEELRKTRKLIADYETELSAYDMALQTIESISENIHGNFAETFNRHVSEIIQTMTSGKYSDVRVTNQMEIRVLDQTAGKLAELEALSGGTIDQIYFAVRFAIADLILHDRQAPLFLDDCFVQYDEARLAKTLRLVSEQSKQHQILLMSCRNAESQMLRSIGAAYREITI